MGAALILTPEQQGMVALSVEDGAVALAGRMQLVTHVISQMEEGTHFGASFPGDKKKNLLKPGADYLGVAFQLVPTFDVERIDLPGGHREYSVKCSVTGRNGQLIGNGLGSCTTLESKYRYRYAKKKCPNCGQETIIKGNEKYGGGWVCWKTKGGCDAKFRDGAPEIEQQLVGKVENPDPADQYNTCLKIAKKRAQVDAMITATGCSAEFTQDVEDMQHEAPAQAPAQQQQAQPVANTPPATPAQTPPPAAAGAVDVQALVKDLSAASTMELLQRVWQDKVVKIQTTLASADLTVLLKARRAAEAKFA